MAITSFTQTKTHLGPTAQSNRARRRQHSRFNVSLMFFLAAPLLAAMGFNTVVDPYGVYGRAERVGLNHVRPRLHNSDRLSKAITVIREQPEVVILGSSRAKQGLDPDHPQLQAQGDRVYNLALNGINSYEQLRYFQHLLANQPQPRLIVIGLDFFMFNQSLDNQAGYEEYRLERRRIPMTDWVNITFSLDALQASYDTVMASREGDNHPHNYGQNGFMPDLRVEDGITDWRFAQSLQLYYQLHADYELSATYIEDFATLVALAHERNIPVIAFFSPAHAVRWEGIRLTGQWSVFEDWKREMVAIMPVWDFTGYDEISTEPIAPVMTHYTDESHYRVSVGNRILDQILESAGANSANGLGTLLTPDTVETRLAQIRRDREAWAAANPEVVAWVAEQRQLQLERDAVDPLIEESP